MLYYKDKGYHHVSCFPVRYLTDDYENFCYENGYNTRKRIGNVFTKHLNDNVNTSNYSYELKNHRFTKENTDELNIFGRNIQPLEGHVGRAIKQVVNKQQ